MGVMEDGFAHRCVHRSLQDLALVGREPVKKLGGAGLNRFVEQTFMTHSYGTLDPFTAKRKREEREAPAMSSRHCFLPECVRRVAALTPIYLRGGVSRAHY
jgi:hypothetical protein